MGDAGAAMWLLFFIACMIVVAITTMHNVSTGVFVFLGCVLGLLSWYFTGIVALYMVRGDISNNESRESEGTGIGVMESEETENSGSGSAMRRVRAEREAYWQDTRLFCFATRAHVARLAIRHLPPVICFRGDETSVSQRDCSICMEDFQNGELIQPFGVCPHAFHSSCVNSWLLGGQITCPLCRKDLPITIY